MANYQVSNYMHHIICTRHTKNNTKFLSKVGNGKKYSAPDAMVDVSKSQLNLAIFTQTLNFIGFLERSCRAE